MAVAEPNCLPAGVASSLVALASRCHARGWVDATSGNFSARADERSFAISASGLDKGALGPGDLLLVDLDGRPRGPGKPSAETALHAQLYRRRPAVSAVVHTHSVPATVLSAHPSAQGGLLINGFEMLKALSGITSHEATVRLPIFPNDQDVARLAAQVDATIADDPSVYGYLIAGHGLYTWGRDVAEAARHVEALEFLLRVILHTRRLREEALP
jgi:methylthioribulose-1-phosphate dehydratase